MNRHLSTDELLDRLYGIAGEDAHVEQCPECAQRFGELRGRRASLTAGQEIPSEFLAAQRRRIYSRLGEQPRTRKAWAPALAAMCLLVIGVLIYRPAAPVHTESADAQLFAEVYSMEQSTEPRAAAPIHALFEDNQ